jgi:tetratricopeptide (TPR) repeat protein
MNRWVVLGIVVIAVLTASSADAQKLVDEQSRRQAMELYRTGQDFMANEQFEKAAEAYKSAIDKDPLLSVAHYQLGQANMALKRFASAIMAYQGCIDSMSSLHQLEASNQFEVDKVRQETIRELRTELNSTSQKMDDLKKTVLTQRLQELEVERTAKSGGPFRAPAFVMLAIGSAHFRNGDRESAQSAWEAAVQTNPKYGEAHNNLAVLYMLSGRKGDAENAVKQAERAGFKVNPQLKADIKKLN